jgi:hypothetical protein
MNTTELLKQASALEKKACTDFVSNFTQSGIVSLVQGGVEFDKAAQLMKEACENHATTKSLQLNVVAFEKAAEYIEELEAKLSAVEKVAEEAQVEVQKLDEKNPLNKLASIGFTEAEIAMIAQLPENLIEKVAVANSTPWEMGGAVGMAREKTDPLLEFLIG